MARYEVEGAAPGFVTVPDQPSGGGGGSVLEGLSGASQSYPAVSGFVGYGTLYLDRNAPFRKIQPGFNGMLTINSGAWPPGYRVPNGSEGGGYPASGTQAKGDEPIRICPPVSGVNRVQYLTNVKFAVRNPSSSAKATFASGLGVVWPSEFERPMRPYLGYAHDAEIDQLQQETLGPGEARTVTMFRVDTCDTNMNGGITGWPNWKMNLSSNGNKMYPAVGISFKNAGGQMIEVGQIFAVGVVL